MTDHLNGLVKALMCDCSPEWVGVGKRDGKDAHVLLDHKVGVELRQVDQTCTTHRSYS